MIPTQKISQTLIEFAEPLLAMLEENYSQRELEGALKLAVNIWNACVLDQWQQTSQHVEAIQRAVSNSGNAISTSIVAALIVRKRVHFGNDPRAITNECVIVRDGNFVVRAEARLDVENLPVEGDRAH